MYTLFQPFYIVKIYKFLLYVKVYKIPSLSYTMKLKILFKPQAKEYNARVLSLFDETQRLQSVAETAYRSNVVTCS